MYQISAKLKHAYRVIAIFAGCAKRRKQKNFFESLIAHILGMAEGIFFKF